MDPVTVTGLFSLGKTLIEKVWPDPAKQAEELRKLEELHQKGELAELQAHVQLMLGQLEINKTEAQSKSLFVAGWRPFVGWVGGIGLAYQYLIYPFLLWLWAAFQANGVVPADLQAPPVLDFSELFTLLLGMLGIGMMRSYDKKNGTQTDAIS